MTDKDWTAQDLYEMLKPRYPMPSWALMAQVADCTGGGNRYADAVAFACWPSLGFTIAGFEIKVNRGDWLHEIRNAEKSSQIFRFCDQWWIVAPEWVVQEGELPPTWGLMVPDGKELKVVAKAPQLTPEPLTKAFMASVLRNSMSIVTPEGKLKEQYDGGHKKGLDEGEAIGNLKIESLKKEIDNLKSGIQAFEKALGIKFPAVNTYWNNDRDCERLGMAVRYAMSQKRDRAIAEAQRLGEGAKRIIEAVEEALKEAREAAPLPWEEIKPRRKKT